MSARLLLWLQEPLLQFLLIGFALFVAYSTLNPAKNQAGAGMDQIELTEDDILQLKINFSAQWQRPPTKEELSALIDDRVREEVLYREALAMGLDKDDSIVKRRMAQKMDFLAEDVSDLHEPTNEELRNWFNKNSEQFAYPALITFRHIYFSPDRRGNNARTDAENVLSKLTGKPEDSPSANALADPFMFQDFYGDRTLEQISKEFGPDFALSLFKLKPGSWQGPIESGYGWHLVWIDSITPSRIPHFEEVETEVKSAWTEKQRAVYKKKAYEAMKKKYQVVIQVQSANRKLNLNLPVYGNTE